MSLDFSVSAIIKGVDKISAPMRAMQASIRRFSRTARNDVRRLDSAFSGFRRNVTRSLGVGVAIATAAAAKGMKDMVTEGMTLNTSLRETAGAFKQWDFYGKQMMGLKSRIAGVSEEVGRFQNKVSLTALELGRAGVSTGQAGSIVDEVEKFARVAKMEGPNAAEALMKVMQAFGKMGPESEEGFKETRKNLKHMMNVMASSSVEATTNIQEMLAAYRNVASIATATGESFEDVSTLIAIMANNMLGGARAGTALKQAFKELKAAYGSPDKRKWLEKLGIDIEDAETGKLRKFMDVLPELKKKLDGVKSEATRIALIDTLFGRKGMEAVLKAMKEGTKGFEDMKSKILKDPNAFNKMYGLIAGGPEHKWKQFKVATQNALLGVFDGIEPELVQVIKKLTKVAKDPSFRKGLKDNITTGFSWLIKNRHKVLDAAVKITKVVAAVYALTVGLGVLNGILTLTSLLAALNPVSLLVLGVVALTAAVGASVYWCKEFRQGWLELPTAFRVLSPIVNVLGLIASWFHHNEGGTRSWGETLKLVFTDVKNVVVQVFKDIGKAYTDMIESLGGFLGVTGALKDLGVLPSVEWTGQIDPRFYKTPANPALAGVGEVKPQYIEGSGNSNGVFTIEIVNKVAKADVKVKEAPSAGKVVVTKSGDF